MHDTSRDATRVPKRTYMLVARRCEPTEDVVRPSVELRPMDSPQGLSSGRRVAIALLIAWFVAVVWWALQPVTDAVPTSAGTQPTSQVVHCDAPLSGNDGPSGPVPSLPPGQAFQREPCTQLHTQYRALFLADAVLTVVVIVLLIGVRQKRQHSPEPVDSATKYASQVS